MNTAEVLYQDYKASQETVAHARAEYDAMRDRGESGQVVETFLAIYIQALRDQDATWWRWMQVPAEKEGE